MRMMPHTGRTHQLRLHAARALGCPILGDDLYWDAAAEVRRGRRAAADAVSRKEPAGGVSAEGVVTEGGGVAAEEVAELPALRKGGKGGGLFLQSCGVRFSHPDEQRMVQVDVAEAPKFAALKIRARNGVAHAQAANAQG